MRLTRKKAIELCIELWEWLAKTGKNKEDWPEWIKYEYVRSDCWFCEYDWRRRRQTHKKQCHHCPLGNRERACVKDFYYGKWCNAKTPQTRKKYAKLFLKQIKTLRR